jgi:hypothetical protein
LVVKVVLVLHLLLMAQQPHMLEAVVVAAKMAAAQVELVAAVQVQLPMQRLEQQTEVAAAAVFITLGPVPAAQAS